MLIEVDTQRAKVCFSVLIEVNNTENVRFSMLIEVDSRADKVCLQC